MGTLPGSPPTQTPSSVLAGILRRVSTILGFLILQAAILFTCAGRLDWTWPWLYMAISLVTVLVNGSIMLRVNPETIAERGQPGETKDWDKVVGGLWALALYLVVPAVAGLDARFGWTGRFPAIAQIAGALLLVVSGATSGWAMISNAYFSTAVRIQSDRGHTVCRTGPYRYIRHPGYLGFILQSLAVPILLGSVWTLIPGSVAAFVMIIRTTLEDRTLETELPGYHEYSKEVRYRLVAGIW
jgi:protein-S-isoprenylcysteine O-methyltransferase Ste14